MSALAQRIEEDLQSRAANDDDINGGLWTRTKYAYVGNQTVSKTDPTGFFSAWDDWGGGLTNLADSGLSWRNPLGNMSSLGYDPMEEVTVQARRVRNGVDCDEDPWMCNAILAQFSDNGLVKDPSPYLNISAEDDPDSPCGAQGGATYPDDFEFFSFDAACREHDNCYGNCSKSKAECDREFHANMVSQCPAAGLYAGPYCIAVATSYYAAVNVGGGRAFRAARGSRCGN